MVYQLHRLKELQNDEVLTTYDKKLKSTLCLSDRQIVRLLDEDLRSYSIYYK
jgi:hypothetical protein